MKRKLAALVLVSIFVLSTTAISFAAGMPAAHGASGREFGGAVSRLATANPAGLVEHVSGR